MVCILYLLRPEKSWKISGYKMVNSKFYSRILAEKWQLIALIFIILVGIALRSYCFGGMWGTDDGEYGRLANALARGDFDEFVKENYIDNFNAPAQLPFRFGMTVPLALLFRLFGVNEAALFAYPLFLSVSSIILAFLFGRLLFNTNAGIIAAALWAVFPEDVSLATSFLPDAIASFYGSLGILIVLFIMQSNPEGSSARLLGGLFAGFIFGLSWLSKESIIYLVPFCLFLLGIDVKKNFKAALPLWAGIAMGSGGILLTEMLTYHTLKGDFLLRMHEIERSHVQAKSYLFFEGSRFGWPEGGSQIKAIIKRLFLDGPSDVFLNPRFLFLPLFGLLATAYAVYWSDRSFLVPALWMLTLAFMYNFGSVSLSSYSPLPMYSRYPHPLMLPAAVLTAGLITKILAADHDAMPRTSIRERFFWGLVVACLVVTTSLYMTFRQVRDCPEKRALFDEMRIPAKLIKPSDRLYTDPLSSKALEFYWGYPRKMNMINFEGMQPEDIKPGSFVLVNKYRLDWLNVNVSMWLTKEYGYHKPAFSGAAPDSWTRLWSNNGGTLYRVIE